MFLININCIHTPNSIFLCSADSIFQWYLSGVDTVCVLSACGKRGRNSVVWRWQRRLTRVHTSSILLLPPHDLLASLMARTTGPSGWRRAVEIATMTTTYKCQSADDVTSMWAWRWCHVYVTMYLCDHISWAQLANDIELILGCWRRHYLLDVRKVIM